MLSIGKLNSKISVIKKMPDLRKRIIFTLVILLVARIGVHIPSPGVDISKLTNMVKSSGLLSMFNLFSGGAFSRASIFALGVLPYIDASIIMQLMGVVVPKIEEIQKEGDQGQEKVLQWTRYLTIAIAIVQSIGVSVWLIAMHMVTTPNLFLFIFTTVTILTAGSMFLMWIGEQITVYGVGNGISIIIFVNIISRVPAMLFQLVTILKESAFSIMIMKLVFLALFFILVTLAVVIVQLGERRIPVQYAGKGFGGNNKIASRTYIPLKLAMAGVIPIIFAYVILMMPMFIVNLIPSTGLLLPVKTFLGSVFAYNSATYLIFEFLIVVFFSFFYTAIVFDPEKVAENLKQGGGAVPGVRPGKETELYLEKVTLRITTVGSIFLGVVAILPNIFSIISGLPMIVSGIGLLIIVGVALDTVQQVDAHLVMREYEGIY